MTGKGREGGGSMDTERLRRYAKLDQMRLRLQRDADDLKDQLRILESGIMEEMAAEGVPQVRVDVPDVGKITVYLRREIWAKCVDGDWMRACAALKDAGLGEFVEARYNTTSFSAYLRELDRDGQPLPEPLVGAIDAEERHSVRTRRTP
jgi:hypothetical protein